MQVDKQGVGPEEGDQREVQEDAPLLHLLEEIQDPEEVEETKLQGIVAGQGDPKSIYIHNVVQVIAHHCHLVQDPLIHLKTQVRSCL